MKLVIMTVYLRGIIYKRDLRAHHFDGTYTEFMSRFWDLETMELKEEEPTPVENYLRNIKMNENTTRYETNLSFKDDFVLLPDNYELCRKLLICLYKTLKNDPELLEANGKIFKEQSTLEILEQIDTPNWKSGQVHHLPHHPVIRLDKETKKVDVK